MTRKNSARTEKHLRKTKAKPRIANLTGNGWTLFRADVLEALRQLPDGSVHCVVTSPPYWGLRDYGLPNGIWGGDPKCNHRWDAHVQPAANGIIQTKGMTGKTLSKQSATRKPKRSAFCSQCGAWRGQLGLEPTPELYVEHLAMVFREVRRVLRDDGTLWLNLGDSYLGSWGGYSMNANKPNEHSTHWPRPAYDNLKWLPPTSRRHPLIKLKDLVGIPWRVALALQADGYFLRTDVIWSKPNCLPESVRDRPTRAHEYLFLFSKSKRYFYDIEAVRQPFADGTYKRIQQATFNQQRGGSKDGINPHRSAHRAVVNLHKRMLCPQLEDRPPQRNGRNLRTVWTIATQPYPGAHFAAFPEKLVEPCILAGTSAKGCCSTCGAPYVRIVTRQRYGTRPGRNTIADPTHMANRDPKRHLTDVTTLGWKPGCLCKPRERTPCTVLDPFAGTSTTGVVALKHRREYIGIELSREYCKLSKKRLRDAIRGPRSRDMRTSQRKSAA